MSAETKQKIENLLNPDNFRDWLNTQIKGTIVGVANNENACPLVCFLKDNGINVQIGDLWIVLEQERMELPEWCMDFIDEIDGNEFPVEKSEAIYCLDIVAAKKLKDRERQCI
ncbi:MAG: hypothetical protein AAGA60_10855 [Cyanobacteria bacterium P01_E01_bin.42]